MTYYKAFDQDMTCRGFQYEVGQTYNMNDELIMCKQGFHCCANALNCLEYYKFRTSRFCEVTIGSNSITKGGKTVTNQITIVREIVGDELNKLLTGNITWPARTLVWYKNGVEHRDNDLPAVEYKNGDKEWRMYGKLHRENGKPAVEWVDGRKEWWVNGKPHRDGGLPAVEYANGNKEWWVNGKLCRKE
jgi:hypothetical protein